MALIKSLDEIEKIKKSCKILASIKKVLKDAVRPGISLKDLDSIAYNETLKHGALPAFKGYMGFPSTICASVNEELIHGIPSDRVLIEGDLLSIDMGVVYENYYSDSAFTISVGKPTKENSLLIDIAYNAFLKGLHAIKPGATLGDVGYAIGTYIKKNNMFTPKEYCGHGIGTKLHEEPYVFNEGFKNKGLKLVDGMVICIEPMILQGSNKIKVLKDGWTVISANKTKSAHHEETILIKNGKGVILT